MKHVVLVSMLTLLCATALAADKKGAKPAPAKDAPKAAAKVVGSCDDSAKGSCREYTKFDGIRTEKDEKDVCDKTGGTWKSKEACPTANLLGSCAKESGETQKWYDAGGNKGLKPASAKDGCEALGGKFTAP